MGTVGRLGKRLDKEKENAWMRVCGVTDDNLGVLRAHHEITQERPPPLRFDSRRSWAVSGDQPKGKIDTKRYDWALPLEKELPRNTTKND